MMAKADVGCCTWNSESRLGMRGRGRMTEVSVSELPSSGFQVNLAYVETFQTLLESTVP